MEQDEIPAVWSAPRPLTGLLRQSLFGRLARCEDVNDADHLAHDGGMPAVVDRNGLERGAASTSRMGGLETAWLTGEANLAALADLFGAWMDQVHSRRPQSTVVLDMDSGVSKTDGGQEGSAYNGHSACTCYHPLFVFNQFGDLERCVLRPGDVHSADGRREMLEPVMTRYHKKMRRRFFRGDAGNANPDICEFLEAESYKYTTRLPANSVLQESISWLLKRPVGRPMHKVRRYYASFGYEAGSWSKARRAMVNVEWHPDELYLRVGFIVTNMTRSAERVVAFYNHRGTAEQWIIEGKNAVTWTRLSCHRFAANVVRMQLHALAYKLANFLRTLALPEGLKQWLPTTLRNRLAKIGARVVRHGRSIAFQMAEVAAPRVLFQEILAAITALRPLPRVRC